MYLHLLGIDADFAILANPKMYYNGTTVSKISLSNEEFFLRRSKILSFEFVF